MALVPLGPPMNPRPVIATGQQIGAGWSPALAIAKDLAALAEARRTGAEAVYWLADEDHDRAEVASVVGWGGPRAGCPGRPSIRPRPRSSGAPCLSRRTPPCAAMSWPWASPFGSAASAPSPPPIPRCGSPSSLSWSAGGHWTYRRGSSSRPTA